MNNYTTDFDLKQINSRFLKTDADYQRPVDPQRIKKIVDNFNPLLVNPIKVSKRSDGSFYVFDGQHTLNALIARNNGKNLMVNCKVFNFLNVTDKRRKEIEASLFAEQNGLSRGVLSGDKFKARYIAGDEDIIRFHDLTKASGVKMDFTKNKEENKIVCFMEAYKAYKMLNPSYYVDMLVTIREAWGGDKDSFRREIIGGMALLYSKRANEFKKKTLVRQLAKVSPLSIIRNGNLSDETGNWKYMEQIIKAYNKGLRKKLQ